MSTTIQQDFDRLAALDDKGWTHNNHFHRLLLRRVPDNCQRALEVGCGTGAFARLLAGRAHHVLALDLSPEMIRVAQAKSPQYSNIEYQLADVMACKFPPDHFDYIASIATLHHVNTTEAIKLMKRSLKPGGVLAILDLFQERDLPATARLFDTCLSAVSLPLSGGLRLLHNGRLKPPAEVQAAWEAHGQHDSYPTLNDVRVFCADFLPGAEVKKHLFWRYSIFWTRANELIP